MNLYSCLLELGETIDNLEKTVESFKKEVDKRRAIRELDNLEEATWGQKTTFTIRELQGE